jgi:hypothetical protein
MGAFRADKHAVIFISVVRIAFWAVWQLHDVPRDVVGKTGRWSIKQRLIAESVVIIAQSPTFVGCFYELPREEMNISREE